MSPRRPTPDPLDVARALADESERASRADWKRALVASARIKLNEAEAGLADSEAALRGYTSPVVDMMRSSVEARRRQIERILARLDAIDNDATRGSE